MSVLLSDSFNRPDAGPSSLGPADLAQGGVGNHYYSPLFPTGGNAANPVGANLTANALQNYSNDYGGVELTAYADAASNATRLGENLGQDLNLQADVVVPTDNSAHISEAGLFFHSQANARGDNLFAGTNAGFWAKLQSTGQVEIERLDTGAVVAYSGFPVTFDTAIPHYLQVAVQGNQLQVAIDGKLLELSENGLVSTAVTLPAAAGGNGGAAGILFGDEPNRGQISGQRADNLVISNYTSLSALPVQNNFEDRFEPNDTFATAANLGAGPGVHLANLSIQTASDQDWYKFQLLRPDQIDVNMGFVHANGELALEVRDAGNTLLATGSSTAGGSVVALTSALAAGTYYIHVSGVGGAMNTYGLAIVPDAVSTTTVYYVNDGSQINDYYTLAPGNDANDGLTPATPKASVQSVLDTYTLGPTSLVVIDTGTYTTPVAITSADQGAAYAGSPGGSNFTYGGNRFELTDADSNEFYALYLTGSGGIGFNAQPGGAANSRRNTFLNDTFNGPDIAIEINGGDSDVIQNNAISGGGTYGIYLPSVVSATVSGNTISGCGTAISASGTTGSNLAVDSNTLSATSYGINFGYTPGTISNNHIITNNLSTGFGIYVAAAAAIFGNDVSKNYVGILSNGGATVYGNTIYNNVTGLQGSGTFGGTSWAAGQPNDVHDNTTGIESNYYGGMTVQFSRVHGNAVGILATGSNDTIQHNLVYRNTGQGILIDGGRNVAVTSNTIYTPSGDGVRVRNSSSNVSLDNNILWTNSGYDLYVATDSQVGFTSDYNNLYTTNPGDPTATPGTAALVWWQKSFTDLFDWQVEASYDVHSIGYTALAPGRDNPQFVKLAGDNYQLTNIASTSIAAGDPASAFNLQPAPNGGRIELGAYGDTPQAAQSTAEYLRIDYPNYYTDWEASVGHPILWHSYNVSGNVKIQLFDATGTTKLADIADVPASQGSFGWSPQSIGIAGDSTTRYVIRITSDSVSTLATSSREAFSVPAASSSYYVNDSSTTGDEYTTAAGNNRNTGTTPGDPKANLLPMLQSYSIGPGDTVYIDTGTYVEVRNVVLSGNAAIGTGAGATFTGPLNHTTTLDRGNTNSYSTDIELNDAGSVTLTRLSLVDANHGLWVHNQSIRFTGTYLTLANNSGDGMTVESDSSQSVFGHLTAYGNGANGIGIYTAIGSLGNCQAYNNGTGIYVSNSTGGSPSIVGDANLSSNPAVATDGNVVHDNSSVGIYIYGNVLAAGNTVYGQTGSGAVGIEVQNGGVAEQNVVHDNYYGIGDFYEGGQALNNRVYNSSQAGISVNSYYGYGAVLQGNTVYSNGVGVQLSGYYGNDQLSNNLIYGNVNQGILVNGVSGVQITNNTIYQPVGDAVRIQGGSSGIALKNNILWTQTGYDLYVTADSEQGFSSDYNDLATSAGGQVALWQDIARPTLTAWQNTAFTDQNSLAQPPLFVNLLGADGVLGYSNSTNDGRDDDFHIESLYGSLHGGSHAPAVSAVTGHPFLLSGSWTNDAAQSPAIDRGDAASSFSAEPAPNGGYVNLGSDGNTDQASKSPASYVLVTKPTGGEVWPAAQTFPIGWRSLQAGRNALSYNGSTSYVDMGNPAGGVLDLSANATLEAWVRFDALPSNSIATIAGKDAGTGNTNKWIFGYANNYYCYNGSNYITANATVFLVNTPTGGQTVLTSSAWTPALHQWYHLALVKTGNSYAFYLNGVLQDTTATTMAAPAVAASFQVGRAEGAYYLQGQIDDLRLWNVSRAAGDIQANMNRSLTGAESGLVGYWPFDEGSGGTTADLTANHSTGTLGGGVSADQPSWLASTAPTSVVNIDLMQNTAVVSNIATGVSNNGQYLWSIPAGTSPGNYSIRVTRPDAALADTSLAPFTIVAPVHVYYVNDATVLAGDWTTAPGNNANNGLTPATPKASIVSFRQP